MNWLLNLKYPAVALKALLYLGLTGLGGLDLRPLLKRRPGRKIPRIAFQAYSIHLAQFFRPLIEELKKEGRELSLQFIILPHPHFPLGSLGELRRYARQTLGIPEEDIKFQWQATWRSYDLFFCTDVFAKFPPRSVKKCIIFHGPGLTERFLEPGLFRKSVLDFDWALVNGEYDYELVQTFAQARKAGTRVISAGLPFLDDLAGLDRSRDQYLSRLGLDPARRTVLIAPSWRGLSLMKQGGVDYFETVVSNLKNLGLNLILKPHACSYNRVMANRVDWRRAVAEMGDLPGVAVDPQIDDLPSLASSEVLVTDISSRAYVFFLLNKPVLHYFPAPGPLTGLDVSRLEIIRKHALSVTDPAQMAAIISRLPENNPRLPELDQDVGRLFSNIGRSAKSIVALIRDELLSDRPSLAAAGERGKRG